MNPRNDIAPSDARAEVFAPRAADDADRFRPAWWARSGVTQTILAGVGHRVPAPERRLERWATPDGDRLRLHFAPTWNGRPWILLLHGLEGSAESAYAREMARVAAHASWNFVALEFRSCGGEDNLRARSYHSGETEDLAFVVDRLGHGIGDAPLFAVGYSLGANVLLKWLGKRGDRAGPVRAAAAVSTPFDLEVAARLCDRRWGGRIAKRFLATLVPKALRVAERFPGLLDVDAVRRCRSFAEFDEIVTAPLHGFSGAEDYWRSCSSARFVPAIRRPTLLVHAEDDPIAPGSILPRAEAARSPFLVPEFSKRGGHCGFVEGGLPWHPRRWAESRILRFFADCLDGGW